MNLVENLSVDKNSSEIYELLYRSDTPEKLREIIVEYIYNQVFTSAKKTGHTYVLDLTRGARKERALQSIFQNIINNTDIIDILAGNSITVIPGSYSGTYPKHKLHLDGKIALQIK